jgi:hypothetical protein
MKKQRLSWECHEGTKQLPDRSQDYSPRLQLSLYSMSSLLCLVFDWWRGRRRRVPALGKHQLDNGGGPLEFWVLFFCTLRSNVSHCYKFVDIKHYSGISSAEIWCKSFSKNHYIFKPPGHKVYLPSLPNYVPHPQSLHHYQHNLEISHDHQPLLDYY